MCFAEIGPGGNAVIDDRSKVCDEIRKGFRGVLIAWMHVKLAYTLVLWADDDWLGELMGLQDGVVEHDLGGPAQALCVLGESRKIFEYHGPAEPRENTLCVQPRVLGEQRLKLVRRDAVRVYFFS
jgi:hypothetical protein